MKNLILETTFIEDLKVIEHKSVFDSRGFLNRLFCQETLKDFMKNKTIKQINKTFTKKKGTLRGMHYQIHPFEETKIVSCLRGKVLDVVVDLRKKSSTFLNHFSIILSAENFKSLLVPEGFAHGFQTLTDETEMLYFHTADYNKSYERGLNVLDPILGIKWPEDIIERSKRDSSLPNIERDCEGLDL